MIFKIILKQIIFLKLYYFIIITNQILLKMPLLHDFFVIILGGLMALRTGVILSSILGAIIFSIGWYLFCIYYTHLWNTKYRVTSTYHILSVIASLFTFIFILTLIGISNYKYVMEASINRWADSLKANSTWKVNTFREAYYKVKATGLEDFTNFQNPEGTIPAGKPESQQLCASVFSNDACANFKEVHPLLAKIAWTNAGIPTEILQNNIKSFFSAHPGSLYQAETAINLVSGIIKQQLIAQIPRFIIVVKIFIIFLFFIFELIPFGLIGMAAYNDLKIKN